MLTSHPLTLTPCQPSSQLLICRQHMLKSVDLNVEICSKLLKVKSFKADGPDSIPNRIIREYAIELAEPMAKIFNQSLSSSKVPTLWKDADLTPVPKIQAVTCENELQSIALTASLSKVLEDFVVTWLFQDIRHKIDINPHYLRVCFLDFSKAFDRINHNILITKLIALGARRCLIPWIWNILRISFEPSPGSKN